MRSASVSPFEPNAGVVIASRSFRLVGVRGLPSRNHLFRNPNGDRLHVATRKTFCENLTGRVSGLVMRSEEHTSELQSLMRISYAVFCLTKKKQSHTISRNMSVPSFNNRYRYHTTRPPDVHHRYHTLHTNH